MMDDCTDVESQMQFFDPENNDEDDAAMASDSDSLRSDEDKHTTESKPSTASQVETSSDSTPETSKVSSSEASEEANMRSLSSRNVTKAVTSTAAAPGGLKKMDSKNVLSSRKCRAKELQEVETPAGPTSRRNPSFEEMILASAKAQMAKKQPRITRTPETSVASSSEGSEYLDKGFSPTTASTDAAAGGRTGGSSHVMERLEYGAFHEAPGLQSRRSQTFSRSSFQRRSFLAADKDSPPTIADDSEHPSITADDSTEPPPMEEVVEANIVEDVVEVEAKPIEWWTPKVVFALVLIVLTILSVVTGTAMAATRKNSKTTTLLETVPTASPTFSPEARKTRIMDIVMDAYIAQTHYSYGNHTSTLMTVFDDPESPQAMALQWLGVDDEYKVDLDDRRHVIERYVLAVLYFATGGDQWTDSFEFLAPSHQCSWSGALRCCVHDDKLYDEVHYHDDEQHYHDDEHSLAEHEHFVTGINLRQNNLVGMLPHELGMIRTLKSFIVDSNGLSGELPVCLQELNKLTDLNINQNRFFGTIPSEMFARLTDLEVLIAYDNEFTGSIPTEIGSSSLLSTLMLHDNYLSGPIPDELWELTDMKELDLGSQSLSGTICSKIGQWLNLTTLHMSELTGVIGTLPSQLGLLTDLESLKISQNHMSGSLPTELGQLTRLVKLSLSRNGFNGTVPEEFTRLTNLKELYIQNTLITGDMNFVCDAVEDGNIAGLSIINADMSEVNCTCCSCCLY